MRWLWICCALLLLCGCDRDRDPETLARATVTHPWELESWQVPPELAAARQPAMPEYDAEQQVETPNRHGPVLPEQDTLDPQLLPGTWLQICFTAIERLNLVPPGEMNLIDLRPDGSGTYYAVHEYKATQYEGSWSKTRPGVVELGFGENGVTQEMYGQLFEEDFLYLWNYDNQEGLWLARARPEMSPPIQANHFETTRGEMRLTDVVAQSYQGQLIAENEIVIAGYYEMGVLSMRWEDERGNLGGYAAFLVSPDWQQLTGVWWIDDYQAAPFGGGWNGTRVDAGQ